MLKYTIGDKDITRYVESMTWSGDISQAARRIDFSIAYTTKDPLFVNLDVPLGSMLYVYEDDLELFRGIVFFRQRSSDGCTMQFTAYDHLIYLAKSKTTRKFKNITVESVVTQICNELGLVVGEIVPIGVYVDFIADEKPGIEIIRQAFDLAYAQNKKRYHVLMNAGKLYVVEKGTVVETYVASDKRDIERTTYSESIEEMINQVLIVDENGNSTGYISKGEQIDAYGLLQDVYKIDPKQDTQTQANALLKGVAQNASISAIGNTRCIAGLSIVVDDEQVKGQFAIKSDLHTFKNNLHTMELELEFEAVVNSGK